MKCLSCNKEYTENLSKCPDCGCAFVRIAGDFEKEFQQIQTLAEQYRKEILKQYEVGLIANKWKEKDGKLVLDHKWYFPIARCDNLFEHEICLEQKFARIPSQEEITVEIKIYRNGSGYLNVMQKLKNLPQAEFVQFGAVVREGFQMYVFMKNDFDRSESEGFKFLQMDNF